MTTEYIYEQLAIQKRNDEHLRLSGLDPKNATEHLKKSDYWRSIDRQNEAIGELIKAVKLLSCSQFILLLLPLMLCGCIGTMVPMTTIKGSLAGQPFSIAVPKDIVMEGLTAAAEQNGIVTVKINKLTSTMNPQVITTTADGQAKLISTAVAAGAAVAGQAAGSAVK